MQNFFLNSKKIYDLESIKKYFKLNYLSFGYIHNVDDDSTHFFLEKAMNFKFYNEVKDKLKTKNEI